MSHPHPVPKQPVAAIGAVVFHQDAILLVKRGQPPAEQEWAIPGGKIHLGETLQQAAERELLEETGITIRAGEPIFTFDLIEDEPSGGTRFHYVIVDVMAEYIAGVPMAADDALEARWVTRHEVSQLNLNRFTRKLLREKYQFP